MYCRGGGDLLAHGIVQQVDAHPVLVLRLDLSFHNKTGFTAQAAKPVPRNLRTGNCRALSDGKARISAGKGHPLHGCGRLFPLDRGAYGGRSAVARDLEQRRTFAQFAADGERLTVAALLQEMDIQPDGIARGQQLERQHVEHHLDIAHRIDMAVEVDVAVNDPVLGPLRGVHLADLAGALRRRRGIDDGIGMGVAHPRKIDRRTRPQVDHRPLRHGAAELAARGIGERKVTGREHPAVIADPRGDGIVGVLHGLEIELDRHARKHPRVVVGIERIHAESLCRGRQCPPC